jgi:hypothetical protein
MVTENVEIFNPDTQINARIKLSEKTALITLAKSKGAEGITGLLKLLAKAREVRITL